MVALDTYILRASLLSGGSPPGFGRAAIARCGADWSGLSLHLRLSDRELKLRLVRASPAPWSGAAACPAPVSPRSRVDERPAWTDPPGL